MQVGTPVVGGGPPRPSVLRSPDGTRACHCPRGPYSPGATGPRSSRIPHLVHTVRSRGRRACPASGGTAIRASAASTGGGVLPSGPSAVHGGRCDGHLAEAHAVSVPRTPPALREGV